MNTRFLHNYCKDYAFGGNTFAMELVEGRLFVGVAHCSEKDQFNKAVGRDIATSYLDELKFKYHEDDVEIITIGSDIPSMGKVTGFVVDDTIMFHLMMGDNYRWDNVISHFTIEVLDVDYMAIEGAEMKELLVKYYNEIIENVFAENNRQYIYNENL